MTIDVEKIKADITGIILAVVSGLFAQHVYNDKPLVTWLFALAVVGIAVGVVLFCRPALAALKSVTGIGGVVLSNIRGTQTTVTTTHADIEGPAPEPEQRRTVLGAPKRAFMQTYASPAKGVPVIPPPKEGD